MLCCRLVFMDALTVCANRHFSSAHRTSFFFSHPPSNLTQNAKPLFTQAVRFLPVSNKTFNVHFCTPFTCHILQAKEANEVKSDFSGEWYCLSMAPHIGPVAILSLSVLQLAASAKCLWGTQTGNNSLAKLIHTKRCLELASKKFQSFLCLI